jgi:hypothetical protein
MRILQPARLVDIGSEQRRPQFVLAVDRKCMLDKHAADGSQRQPLDVLIL